MELKTLAFVLLFTFSAHAFSLNKDYNNKAPIAAPQVDFGPAIGDLINSILKNITANGPVELIPNLGPLNLTQILQTIIGEGNINPLKGSLSLSSVALIGLEGAEIVNSTINVPTLRPIEINFDVDLPGVGLGGDYVIDALLLGILPVRGHGRFSAQIDLAAGGGGELRILMPMKFNTFDYNLLLRNIDVDFEGLIGGPELSEQINKIINNFIDDLITPALTGLESALHPFINAIIHDLLDSVVGELTVAKLLEILNGLLNPKP
jgi:hypothetical protein